jgi:hypothetical protein
MDSCAYQTPTASPAELAGKSASVPTLIPGRAWEGRFIASSAGTDRSRVGPLLIMQIHWGTCNR